MSNIRPITATNPNVALEDALWWLKTSGVVNDSRNGRVVQAPAPVISVYTKPEQRVVFSALRDASPFFHLYEALWMLAGRNDVDTVSYYAKQMTAFSDDGDVLHGAYGFRWRHWFGFDQLAEIIALLKRDPKSRRAVLTMWSPNGDLIAAEGGVGGINAKDVPCNTQVYFDMTRGVMDMTVCNRSNDAIWGCYGANVVHMSFLQEFIARTLGVPVGVYYQFSNNFHMYVDREDCQRLMDASAQDKSQWVVRYTADDRYAQGMGTFPLFFAPEESEAWLDDCEAVAHFPTADHHGRHPFFRDVVVPMMSAHAAYKDGDLPRAIQVAQGCKAPDWRAAGVEWLERRLRKQMSGDGVGVPGQ